MAASTYTPDVSTADGRRELNRRIAQTRGYSVKNERTRWIVRLNGEIVARQGYYPDEDYAWNHGIPQPADDNSDALELLAGCSYAYHHRPGRPDHVLVYDMRDGLLISESYADTFAAAAALAWWSAFGRGEGE